MNPALSPVAASLAYRFGLIVDGVSRAAAHHAGKDRTASAIVLLLWSYLRRLTARLDRLLAGGGRTRLARMRQNAAARPRPTRLPQGFGWLMKLVPGIVNYGSQLQCLLDDPELAPLLARMPRAAGMLRPLRRMLGQSDPPRSRVAGTGDQSAGPSTTPLATPLDAPLAAPLAAPMTGRSSRHDPPLSALCAKS